MTTATRTLLRWHLRRAGRLLEALLLPPWCPGCGGEAPPSRLCPACEDGLERLPANVCPLCTGLLPCPDCARFRGRIARVRAAYLYRGTGGRLVRRVKLERDAAALGFLGRALARGFLRHDRAYRRFVLVPVPLARDKLSERGFNQAAELARWLAERLDVTLLPRALVRVRETLAQGSALVTSRAGNVAEAFAPGRQAGRVAGRRVLLVDDVTTSGATLRECARVLRRAMGAVEVEAVVACSARR